MSPRVLVMLIAIALLGLFARGEAQQVALAGQRPHFVRAGSMVAAQPVVEVRNAAVLQRSVALDLHEATVEEALAALSRDAGVRIAYNARMLPRRKRVSLTADRIEVVAALAQILFESGLDVAVARNGQLAVMECVHLVSALAPAQGSGSVVGRVTDRATGSPLVGATVTVEEAGRSATTDPDGRYAVRDVAAGVYTVRARYIGYVAATLPVTVGAGEQVTADFGLEKSAQTLDEVVTTGTYVPTEVKALPTPVSVIDSEDIVRLHPQILNDVIRSVVPTAVSPDVPSDPHSTSFSVRGASSLSGTGQMKVILDGVEMSNSSLSPVDLSSVERIEVVRGPQAATMYGSDAAAGVIQIFTKRGDRGLTRPEISARTAIGVTQTPYSGHRAQLRQDYGVNVQGGASAVGYSFGGSYVHMSDYLPGGELSRQSTPSAYGAMRFASGPLRVDLSARYYRTRAPTVTNPLLWEAGFAFLSRPNFTDREFVNGTYGAQLVLTPRRWWRTQLSLGLDQISLEQVQMQPRLTTADDTLLTVGTSESRKTFLAFNSSVTGRLDDNISGTITAGIDHYSKPSAIVNTSAALNTRGTIVTAPPGAFVVNRAVITNTGYFVQAQTNIRETVYLTGGIRVEENSAFGRDLGAPVLPRVGASLVRQFGHVTVKLRGSYGEAIRAPSAGQSFGSNSPTFVILANPLLGPERQGGWDAGVDVAIGDRVSVSVSGFTQTAKDLILSVQREVSPVLTSQFQNVGRVTNRGIEFEGSADVHGVTLRGQYGYVDSRIRDLGPGFTGDDQVGDRPRQLPMHTAGMSLGWEPVSGTSLSGGVTYVGSYREYDFLAAYACLGGSGPCPTPLTSLRDFIVEYPGFAKLNLSVSQRLSRQLTGYLAVDNLTNTVQYELGNAAPVMGRTTSVGLTAVF